MEGDATPPAPVMCPLHAEFFADSAVHQTVRITAHDSLGPGIWRLSFHSPEIARTIRPGQFVMVRLSGFTDPLIGRAFALFDTRVDEAGEKCGVELVYIVKGNLTSRLIHLGPEQQLDVWGPLGNGFAPRRVDHLILVAGGIGYTPFLAVAKQFLGRQPYGEGQTDPSHAQRVTLCFGARTADQLTSIDDFRRVGVKVRLATDDGSLGHHGLVVDLLRDELRQRAETTHVMTCGPEKMMEAVGQLTEESSVSCEVSLEAPMACGIGICFSCVAGIKDEDGHWDYRRTCVEGPVFDAREIVWRV